MNVKQENYISLACAEGMGGRGCMMTLSDLCILSIIKKLDNKIKDHDENILRWRFNCIDY